MTKTRRSFLKTAVLGSAAVSVGISPLVSADKTAASASNGVTLGKAHKKEITYHKTKAWEDYYKSAL